MFSRLFSFSIFFFAILPSIAFSDVNPTDIIRLCAPSTNIAVKLEGAVGNVISKRLLGAEASGSAEVFQDGELLQMMIAADPDNATVIYKMYLDCVKPQVDQYLEGRISSSPLDFKSGQSFSLGKDTTVTLLDGKYIFSVRGQRNSGSGEFYKVLTTLRGPENRLSQLEIGDAVMLRKAGCQVIATGYDASGPSYRFQVVCS